MSYIANKEIITMDYHFLDENFSAHVCNIKDSSLYCLKLYSAIDVIRRVSQHNNIKFDNMCSIIGCQNAAQHGSHVEVKIKGKLIYGIIPACSVHNKPRSKECFFFKQRTLLVDIGNTCSL